MGITNHQGKEFTKRAVLRKKGKKERKTKKVGMKNERIEGQVSQPCVTGLDEDYQEEVGMNGWLNKVIEPYTYWGRLASRG